MSEQNGTSRSESGVARGSAGYKIACLLLGIIELVFGVYTVCVGVRVSRGAVVGLGVGMLCLGIGSLIACQRQKAPPKTSG
jgi:hypothetical protein